MATKVGKRAAAEEREALDEQGWATRAKRQALDNFLHAHKCPLSHALFLNPVCMADGFTYERAAITEWLRTKDTSPKTGATLESKALIPNLMARSMIRAFNEGRSAFS